MSDKPVLGHVNRIDQKHAKAQLVEISGKLKPPEWKEFMESVKRCANNWGGKIIITEKEIELP